MHKYILEHWIDWFPNLPSYPTLVNRISSIFPGLVACLLDDLDKIETQIPIVLTDSMPIVICSHKRKAKVALEMTGVLFNKKSPLFRCQTSFSGQT